MSMRGTKALADAKAKDKARKEKYRRKHPKCSASWGTRWCINCLRFMKRHDQVCGAHKTITKPHKAHRTQRTKQWHR
jgi:hypothetical protein